jgi:adenine-specific DNA methylase
MTDDKGADSASVPGDALEVETSREKSVRHGHLSTFHPWWSRRPNVLARVAGYLAITEEQQPQTELLTALGKVDVNPVALNEARYLATISASSRFASTIIPSRFAAAMKSSQAINRSNAVISYP